MKLIFVNRFFHPDESATSLMLTDLVEGLAVLDCDRLVITGRSGYAQGSGSRAQQLSGVRTIRLPGLSLGNGFLAARAINFVAFYIGLVITGLWLVRRGDIVVCLTDPPLSNIVVSAIATFKRAKVVNWVQDIYPETATRLGYGSENNTLISLLARARDRTWEKASVNVCIGERMQAMLAGHGVREDRLRVIQNWADDETLRPMPHSENELRTQWNYDHDEIVVGYSGNLGRAHDAVTMLEAADRLGEAANSCFAFLFVGGGAKHDLLKARQEDSLRRGAPIETRGYRERSELRESLSVPDIHWLSLEPQLEGLIVPSKFYGAIAVGRPIIFIGDKDGEIARLIAMGQCGQSFAKGDVEGVTDYLRLLGCDRELRETLGKNARQLSETKLSRKARMVEWQELIDDLKS